MKLESFMDDMTRDLLERLDESKSDSIDTGRWLQLYAFGTCFLRDCQPLWRGV